MAWAARIIEDTRQKPCKHRTKHLWWARSGVEVVRRKLDFGDYMAEGSNVSVDTKRSIDEVAANIGGRQHARFRRECVRASQAGCRLVVLVENREGIHGAADLIEKHWTNGHCRKCARFRRMECDPHAATRCAEHGTNPPIQGERLGRAMATMHIRYGVVFEFCRPSESAQRVCELLGVRWGENA